MSPGTKKMILGANRPRPPTVAAGFAGALIALAARKGADPARLVVEAGIDPCLPEDQDARVLLHAYIALMRAAKDLTGDPAFALHFGEAYEIDELSIVGLIGRACETWEQAFEQIARYGKLVIDVPVDDPRDRRLVIQREGGQVWIVDTRSDPDAFPELTESSFARMAAAVHRRNSGVDAIAAIHFTHKAPAYVAEYERVFELPVVFESGRNALLMKGDGFRHVSIAKPSRYVFGILSERAEALLHKLETETTTRGRAEGAIMPILHTGDATMEAIASRLGLSRRTFARRLKDEGTTFEKLLDDLRRRLALSYLAGRGISASQCAYLTGFSDPASFSRAFKRWTGSSPRDVRRALARKSGGEP